MPSCGRNGVIEFVERHRANSKAYLGGLDTADTSGGEAELASLGDTYSLGQANRHTPDRDQASLAMGIADRRIVGTDNQVAAQDEFQRTGTAVAVDLGDRGLGQCFECVDRLRVS